jgi:predicted nucleic acid-binding protein
MKSVYVDTSALLSILDQSDRDHAEAVLALERIMREKRPLVTSSYVLVESGALVRNRMGMEAFRKFAEAVDLSIEVFQVDESLHDRAWLKTTESGDEGPTLADWTGVLLMQDLGISEALATDPGFPALVESIRVEGGARVGEAGC